jgi:hypothetical protein
VVRESLSLSLCLCRVRGGRREEERESTSSKGRDGRAAGARARGEVSIDRCPRTNTRRPRGNRGSCSGGTELPNLSSYLSN